MTKLQIEKYLDKASKAGIVPGLDTVKTLLKKLDNPEKRLKCVHIAGTNGKGSTAAYITSILNKAGYKTGAYTSPCVFSEFEKYSISGKPITSERYEEIMSYVIEKCIETEKEGSHPTVFEIETAAAFYYFCEELCDYAVIETGMGGLLDATNVTDDTEVSVLTSIAMDHMKFLGDTIEEIACQKGGIIKNNSTAVLYDQNEKVNKVIKDICDEKDTELVLCDVKSAMHSAHYDDENGRLVFSYKEYNNLKTGMTGYYQAANAAMAVETVLALKKKGAVIPDKAITDGISSAYIPGRFEKINDKPVFIIDGAHNPDAAFRLAETIKMYFTNNRLLYIMGVLADKDYDKVAKLTVPLADRVFTVTPDNKRALDASVLSECVSKYCSDVETKDTIKKAVADAFEWAGKDDVIIAFGSLSYIGSVKEIVKEMQS